MIIYDFEVFKHDWMVVFFSLLDGSKYVIHNDREKFLSYYEKNKDEIFIGYNSRHYDQYIFKAIILGLEIKYVNDLIIQGVKKGWEIHPEFWKIQFYNYDVKTTMHSLKELEGFMGNNIKESDISFNINRKLTDEEAVDVIKYCTHDVEQTAEVFFNRYEEFDSQISLLKEFNLPLNFIGKTKPQLAAIIIDAVKVDRDDEFDIKILECIELKKYEYVLDWYLEDDNRDYDKKLETEISGVPHVFAWGGIHGALEQFYSEGLLVHIDVTSYYPALMIEHGLLSRNVKDPDKYRQIRDIRLELKKNKDPRQAPYKIVSNSTYGAMKDQYNNLFDPQQANNVCVNGQLLLLDLIEKLEYAAGEVWKLIQSNTDGIIGKIKSEKFIPLIQEICSEWEFRTKMNLEYNFFKKIFQKDVNNYIIVDKEQQFKSKGAYLKQLNKLDNDLPIINIALKEYFISNIPIETTINNSSKLLDFQRVVKLSSKYVCAYHSETELNEKCIRVFASKSEDDGGVFKLHKNKDHPDKIPNTPEHCFIINDNINDKRLLRKLDKTWYIDLAYKRLEDYIGHGGDIENGNESKGNSTNKKRTHQKRVKKN